MTKPIKISDDLYEALQIMKPHQRASFDEVIRSLMTNNKTEDIKTVAVELQVEKTQKAEEDKWEAQIDKYLERRLEEADEHINRKSEDAAALAMAKFHTLLTEKIGFVKGPLKSQEQLVVTKSKKTKSPQDRSVKK